MNIVATFDSSANSAPAGYKAAVSAACNFFDSVFTNNVTVNINFSWSALGGNEVASTTSQGYTLDYGTVRNALAAHDAATPGLSGVVLPTTDPFSGDYAYDPAGDLRVTTAEAKVLGLENYTGVDASITLNSLNQYNFNDPQVASVPGAFNATATLEHEISEALGRQCGGEYGPPYNAQELTPSPEALLRYSSQGVIDTSSSDANAYLSLDGGKTNAGPGHVGEDGGDLADWSGDVSGDAFGFGEAGAAETVSAADIKLMAALGWTARASTNAVISGTHGTTTTSEAAVTPFSGVTITDANTGAADTLTIALSGAGGSLSGSGLTQNADGTYTLAAASAGTITTELDALRFVPIAGAPDTTSTTRFTITVASSAGTSASDGGTMVSDVDPAVAPAIAGTHGTTTTSEAAVTPFSGVTITDANAGATDTLTIALSGTGGGLSGSGLTQNADGTYTLAAANAATLTTELDALRFTPTGGAPNTASTTRFTITAASSAGTSASDGGTTVSDVDPAVAPAIAGTHGTTTTSEAAVTPFSGVSVTDANAGATDTMTIALSGAGGSLSGSGLTQNADGTYTLAAASAATLTTELDALRFAPARGAPDTTSTTRFTITAASSAGTSASDGGTTVSDVDPDVAPTVVFDATTGGFVNGVTPVLTGEVSAPTGVARVELYSGNPASGGQDLGAATVNADGTWTFQTNLGPGEFDTFTAVATDNAGLSASAVAPYALLTGIAGEPYRAQEFDGMADGTYGYIDYARNGTPLVYGLDDGDGTHTIFAMADGQTLQSIGNDTMTGGGLRERFVFTPHVGREEVTDFAVAGPLHDTVDLSQTRFASLAQVLSHTTMADGSATIHLTPQDSITLDGVSRAQIRANPRDLALA